VTAALVALVAETTERLGKTRYLGTSRQLAVDMAHMAVKAALVVPAVALGLLVDSSCSLLVFQPLGRECREMLQAVPQVVARQIKLVAAEAAQDSKRYPDAQIILLMAVLAALVLPVTSQAQELFMAEAEAEALFLVLPALVMGQPLLLEAAV
jgi:hypothetical protein